MKIAEIFYSIQGEGCLAGMPSVFVRTSGCNLRCNWCDTMYSAWDPVGRKMSVPQILDEIKKHPTKYVVLTGGEPMIAPGIHDLAAQLRENGYHITIETAATILPNEIACDLASLSPKLRNSTPDDRLSSAWQQRHEKLRLQPEVIRTWIARYPNHQLKFVVVSADDVQEIEQLRDALAQLGAPAEPPKVMLMPEGRDLATLRGRNDTLLDLCKRHGFRYCSRLHIELFGNKRGT